jgi:hypothetical protein
MVGGACEELGEGGVDVGWPPRRAGVSSEPCDRTKVRKSRVKKRILSGEGGGRFAGAGSRHDRGQNCERNMPAK